VTTCTIYYPGLLGPDVPLEELQEQDWPAPDQLNHLCKLLSYGKITELPLQHNKQSIEVRILHYLGVIFDEDRDAPVAHIRAQSLEYDDKHLWCLDPVHIQIDLDEAILLANEALELTEKEAHHLIQDINKHFEQDDLYIHYCAPHQWILKGKFELSTATIGDVMHKNINQHQPAGKDETLWRKLVNEIQMLLHSHPVNTEREKKGVPLVNSLWLWGGGRYNTLQTSIDLVYGEHELIANIASVSDLAHTTLPTKLNPEGFINRTSLMIFTDQMHAIRSKDVFGWFDHLKRFDGGILGPLFDMLKQGDLDKLTVHSDTIEITFSKKDLTRGWLKFWQRSKLFSENIAKLRKQYGH